MKLGLSHSARMEQRLVQSPQMIQAMQILQLSALDLQDRIEQELLENPFLERTETSTDDADANAEATDGATDGANSDGATSDGATSDGTTGESAADGSSNIEVAATDDTLRDRIAEDFERLRASEELPPTRQLDHEASDRKAEAMRNTPDRPRSMASALIEQIALVDLDARQREIAEFLIHSLDHRGYLPDPLEELSSQLRVHYAPTRPLPEFLDVDSAADASEITAPAALERPDFDAADDRPGKSEAVIPPVDVRELEYVLGMVRRATHPGLGAFDLQDCLLLQLEARGIDSPLVHQLVEHHLEDLTKNRLPRIAKATGQSIDEIKAALTLLRELEPTPARDYGDSTAAVITPDVIVEEVDGELEVRLGRRRGPSLRLSPESAELLAAVESSTDSGADEPAADSDSGSSNIAPSNNAPSNNGALENGAAESLAGQSSSGESTGAELDSETELDTDSSSAAESERRRLDAARRAEDEDPKKWARRRLESARWFLDAVEQRGNTMLRIARVIFDKQRGFLEKGPKALVPLRMQEVADEAGVHISTVSRAVAGKHAQTPRGIFPLKYFFTSGTTDESGEAQSQVSIQQRIAELVEAEDTSAPYSDDQIAALLQRRFGIRIARRTVTKYRKALSIPSSSQRKQF